MSGAPLLSPLAGFFSLRRPPSKNGVIAASAFALASMAAAGVALIAVFGDPLGGEPRVVIQIDDQPTRLRETISDGPMDAIAGTSPDQGANGQLNGGVIAPAQASLSHGDAGPSAPLSSLIEQHSDGALPRIADDGLRPSKAYARPFRGDGQPLVGLIIGGLGLSQTTTKAAIEELPPEITLSFVPYARDLDMWAAKARERGHEIMVELPLEPYDYPANDPGPYTLLTSHSGEQNLERLTWLLSRFSGYFGVTNYLGGKFFTSHTTVKPVLAELEARGLAYIDTGASARSVLDVVARNVENEWTASDRVIDARVAPNLIDEKLLELEALALQNGTSLGKGSAYPVTIEHVKYWAEDITRRGYTLAPASAILAQRQDNASGDVARNDRQQ